VLVSRVHNVNMCTNLGTDIQRVHAGDELAEESIQFRSLNESVGYSEKKETIRIYEDRK